MRRLGISKQILIIAITPALIVAAILSTHYIWDQFDYISASLSSNGKLLAKQLAPAAEYAIYSGNTELIKPLTNNIINNKSVLRIQILDKSNNSILDVKKHEKQNKQNSALFKLLFGSEKHLIFSEPIYSENVSVEDNPLSAENALSDNKTNIIGNVLITITNQYATEEKAEQIKHGLVITLIVLGLTTIVIFLISSIITQPINSLIRTVKSIASGHLEARIKAYTSGEIGDLQSCINHMADELQHSQANLEEQLNEYTHELQQTMEELEIRNAELDITRSKAIYANNAKSEFLANMSHEIRTPLSGIIGFTELLQETSLTSQQKDYSTTIQKSAKNLLEIINDILDLAKIESGKTEITKSEFNIIDIIEDIINLLSPTALDKNVELFYRIERDVPNIIHADHFRIHQILTNLIGNAIKFTDEGYVYLQVAMSKSNKNNGTIKFTVTDTGIGMNTEDRKNLFNAFTQADNSITRRFGGTGLGLVISQKLTKLMNGDIGFGSSKGKGSTFWFSIPVTHVREDHIPCEITNKQIAFISNNAIAEQAFSSLLENCDCQVSMHAIDELDNSAEIEQEKDAVIVFLGRKDINDRRIIENLGRLKFSKPSLLIASTHSHTELRNLQQHIFDSAAFTSEKAERIKQKLISLISKNIVEVDSDRTDNQVSSSADWSDINVLVVDDNEVNLRLAEIILDKHKARVTTATSGEQAIDYVGTNCFDIILMDLHMPGIDGYETAKKIRELTTGKQPVIIAVTANALTQEKEKITQTGMNGVLIKPVSNSIMQKVINQWILKDRIDVLEIADDDSSDATDHKKIFSIERAKQFTGNNEELAYELFGMFRAEIADYKKAISAAARDNNLAKLREQVHKIHGASRCCGTTELEQRSSYIEKLINEKIDFDIEQETGLLLAAINKVADYKLDSGGDQKQ